MPASNPNPNPRQTADGTRQLLQWGASILGAGLLAAVLLQTLLGVAKWLRNRSLTHNR
jgi:hypothetical protein